MIQKDVEFLRKMFQHKSVFVPFFNGAHLLLGVSNTTNVGTPSFSVTTFSHSLLQPFNTLLARRTGHYITVNGTEKGHSTPDSKTGDSGFGFSTLAK